MTRYEPVAMAGQSSAVSPVVLFRKTIREQEEFDIANKYIGAVESRMDCRNQLVIARYSCLPFYRELEKDLAKNGCTLINTHTQHRWIADFGYYQDLKEFTFKSYTSDNFWNAPEGAYVVKGATNSRKSQWNTHMFAKDKRTAILIAHELRNDGLLCDQEIIYREYVPLKTFEVNPWNKMPWSNEWRFFFYRGKMLTHGYYWSDREEESFADVKMTQEGLDFAQKVADKVGDEADFYVLDIAEKEAGGWILVEVNDGQMSGLSENKPETLYSELAKAING